MSFDHCRFNFLMQKNYFLGLSIDSSNNFQYSMHQNFTSVKTSSNHILHRKIFECTNSAAQKMKFSIKDFYS